MQKQNKGFETWLWPHMSVYTWSWPPHMVLTHGVGNTRLENKACTIQTGFQNLVSLQGVNIYHKHGHGLPQARAGNSEQEFHLHGHHAALLPAVFRGVVVRVVHLPLLREAVHGPGKVTVIDSDKALTLAFRKHGHTATAQNTEHTHVRVRALACACICSAYALCTCACSQHGTLYVFSTRMRRSPH